MSHCGPSNNSACRPCWLPWVCPANSPPALSVRSSPASPAWAPNAPPIGGCSTTAPSANCSTCPSNPSPTCSSSAPPTPSSGTARFWESGSSPPASPCSTSSPPSPSTASPTPIRKARPKASHWCSRGTQRRNAPNCRLLTLDLVLDATGFVQRSQVFAGNVQEATTLQGMIEGLGAEPGALVVLDRGIATAATLEWLEAQGYHYLAVSRERQRRFESTRAEVLSTAAGGQVQVELVRSEDGQQVRLYCYSREREKKEQAIEERRSQRLEAGLEKLHVGLSRPKALRKLESVQQRVGRLKERSKGLHSVTRSRSRRTPVAPRRQRSAGSAGHRPARGPRMRGLQPAQQPHGMGSRGDVAGRCGTDRHGGDVPQPGVGVGSATGVSSQAGAFREVPADHGAGLPGGTGHPGCTCAPRGSTPVGPPCGRSWVASDG